VNDPFVYVGTWTIKPGKLEDAKRFLTEHSTFIEEREPRMIAFHVYFDEEGSKATVVQVIRIRPRWSCICTSSPSTWARRSRSSTPS
jgi:hypothetical protein